MAVEIVEGTLEPGQPKRNKRGYGLFPELTIRTAGGQARTFTKVVSGEPVTSQIIAGGDGRFYLTRFGGGIGLIGVRRPDNSNYYSHYTNMIPVVLVVGALGALMGVAKFGFGVANLPLTPAVVGPLLMIAGFYFSSQKNAARRAFEADTPSSA